MNNVVVYSILQESKNSKDAGPKAKNDVNYFLKKRGFKIKKLFLPKSRLKKIWYRFFAMPSLLKNEKVKNIIFQYPIYSIYLTKEIIKTLRKNTEARIILLVHDIEGLRVYFENLEFEKEELKIFNQVDRLIVHNESMKKYLIDKGITTPIVTLEIFDYFNEQKIIKNSSYQKTVAFAGNLKKAPFLKFLNLKDIKINVYGPNPQKYPKNINYKGIFSPEELPREFKENFGLVWDGDSLDRCSGIFGNYMKYNNPHKTSLYLSSGLPVIIWEKAAMADFILKNHVGIAISNLKDIDKILNNLTAEEYLEMKRNTVNLAKKIRTGQFLSTAVEKVIL